MTAELLSSMYMMPDIVLVLYSKSEYVVTLDVVYDSSLCVWNVDDRYSYNIKYPAAL